ncbi:hypothetical protein [Idiomarina fontislapidosi]|uniref:hypothetical protein n=1 Tax=Idiomarina fontislapidosi TaxID=263723 RepID=UPI000F871180|nr:hypothetical protein [Idiomarina fontislapidosi]
MAHGWVWIVAQNARRTWHGRYHRRSVRIVRTGRCGLSRKMRDLRRTGATDVRRAGIKKPQPIGWGHSI